MKNVFLSAEWRNLIMANYVVDPAILQPYLPAKTTLDFFKGKTYVSLVGFLFADTRIRGIQIPFHVNFEEVNLRFYVKHFCNGEWRRGVVFIKEIVPKPAISFVANTIYKEKYCCMPMAHSLSADKQQIQAGYRWKYKGAWNHINVIAASAAENITAGSEAAFIAEHYFGYSRYTAGKTYEYEVKHPRWQIHPVQQFDLHCDFENIYGKSFSFLQNTSPGTVFMAKGSEVTVSFKKLL